MKNDQFWMQQALLQAEQAYAMQEVPVGAVLVLEGEIIGKGRNAMIAQCDPTAHAEIQAIRAACQQQKNYRLPNSTLYVTLEPCPMCASAIIHSRIARVVYAASEPKTGAVSSAFTFFDENRFNHKVTYNAGLLAHESSALLRQFFRLRR